MSRRPLPPGTRSEGNGGMRVGWHGMNGDTRVERCGMNEGLSAIT